MSTIKNLGCAALLMAATMMFSGCAGEEPQVETEQATTTAAASTDGRDHSGWWCVEHAIPEAECSMCSAAYAKQCKDDGDWCDEHNRAESQCFKCDPSRADKYAKLYQAKYGKEPPAAIE